MPLSIVQDVITEWVKTLQHKQLDLIMYWEGPERPKYKSRTDAQRREQRELEWSNLRAYCDHGVIVVQSHQKTSRFCDWVGLFPLLPLAMATAQHTLQQLGIPRVDCPGEADAVLAAAAASSPGLHYVVGQDSDFTMMRGIQYLPLDCMVQSLVGINGVVIRRSELVAALDLAIDAPLMELALAVGND